MMMTLVMTSLLTRAVVYSEVGREKLFTDTDVSQWHQSHAPYCTSDSIAINNHSTWAHVSSRSKIISVDTFS